MFSHKLFLKHSKTKYQISACSLFASQLPDLNVARLFTLITSLRSLFWMSRHSRLTGICAVFAWRCFDIVGVWVSSSSAACVSVCVWPPPPVCGKYGVNRLNEETGIFLHDLNWDQRADTTNTSPYQTTHIWCQISWKGCWRKDTSQAILFPLSCVVLSWRLVSGIHRFTSEGWISSGWQGGGKKSENKFLSLKKQILKFEQANFEVWKS